MPIRSYFVYIGSLLLALLFLADWYFPRLDAGQSRSDVDRATIRIHSAQKWPQAVVIDTTLPTIVPPPAATVAAAPAPKPALDAQAMATEPEVAAGRAEAVKETKSQVRRTRTARAPARGSRLAASQPFGFGNDMFGQSRRQAFAFRNESFGSRGFWPSW